MNELLAATSVDLVAQVVHVHINDVGEGVEVLIPHVFGDHGPGEDTARVPHQVFEQGIFFQGQVNPLPPSDDFTGRRIKDEVIDLEYAGALGSASPEKGPNPREQLIDGEGFREVVIRSRVEPLDPLVDLRLGGQDQDWSLNAGPANSLEDIEAGQRGQHEVDDDQVVARGERHLKTFRPVFAQIDGVALFLKCALDEGADFRFVFDYEDTHGARKSL